MVHSKAYNELSEQGAGSVCAHNSSLTLQNSSFTNCTAQDGNGGAVRVKNGTLLIETCRFVGNVASGSGGALHLEKVSDASLSDMAVNGNKVCAQGAPKFISTIWFNDSVMSGVELMSSTVCHLLFSLLLITRYGVQVTIFQRAIIFTQNADHCSLLAAHPGKSWGWLVPGQQHHHTVRLLI